MDETLLVSENLFGGIQLDPQPFHGRAARNGSFLYNGSHLFACSLDNFNIATQVILEASWDSEDEVVDVNEDNSSAFQLGDVREDTSCDGFCRELSNNWSPTPPHGEASHYDTPSDNRAQKKAATSGCGWSCTNQDFISRVIYETIRGWRSFRT